MIRRIFLSAIGLFLVSVFYSQTFSSTINQLVPDDGTTMYLPIEASGLPDVLNGESGLVQICLNMDHTYNSDMVVQLAAPDGTLFMLFSGIGGDLDNFTNCCLRFDASDYISNQTPPYSGTWLPMGNMALVNNGQNPNGTWNLVLYDTYAFADQGYMYDWSITFDSNAPEYQYPLESTYLPIVKIFTGGQSIPDEPKVQATMQIINNGDGVLNFITDTNFEYEGEIMVELQGFTGPIYPKKNYDFDLIDSEGLEMDTNLLGMPDENDFILKAEYLDPTLMFNNIAYSFGRKMDRYAPRLRYCELILDGDYLGIYSLTEKIKRDNSRVDIAKLDPDDLAGDSLTGGYIIEMNINGDPGNWYSNYPPINEATAGPLVEFKYVYPKASEIAAEQANYIQSYVDQFEYIMHTENFDDPEEGYRSVVDVPSFIDFMLVNEMSTNYDSYGRSTFMYKEKITDGGLLHIGPPWDYDRGFWNIEGWVWELTHPFWPFPDWWSIMDSDSTYTNQVWCRWQELRGDKWSDEAFINHIDSMHDYLAEATDRNFLRWPELGVTNWDQQVQDLQDRLLARLAWMDANIIGNGPCLETLVNNSIHLEDFEGDLFPPNCWSILDVDVNGVLWNGAQPVAGYNSEHCAFSYGFDPDGENNYLITPQLSPIEGEHITWYVSTSSDNDSEYYEVLLSTTGNNPEDFVNVLFSETIEGPEWRYRGADLTEWWGQEVYIALRHFTSGGQIMLKLDDVLYPTWTNEGQDCTIGINELISSDIRLYPNPAEDIISMSYQGSGRYEILDASGRMVMGNTYSQGQLIDVSFLGNGVYTFSFYSKEEKLFTELLNVIRMQ
jgi:subtilisin-like proprotein convertase family protein